MTLEFSDPTQAQAIPELMAARRNFPLSQQLLAGPVDHEVSAAASVGWHDTDVCAEIGAIAVVPIAGPMSELVGDVVVIKRPTPTLLRGVFAYVIGSSGEIIDDISLNRRAFFALGLLSEETLTCSVSVVA